MSLTFGLSATVCLATMLIASSAPAGENEFVLSVLFDGEIESESTPVVYVQGELAGIAPGSVLVPLRGEGIVLEIGVPQLSIAPLYSFVVKPSEVDQTPILVTVTDLGISQTYYATWSDAYLAPNRILEIPLTKLSENHYQILLPSKPYEKFYQVWRQFNAEPLEGLWFANIPSENNQSTESGYEHVVYDTRSNGIRPLSTTRELNADRQTSWSGGTKPFLGSSFPMAVWTVVSRPAEASGAEVWADSGYVGTTETFKELPMTESFFLTVQKDGFVDASYCENGKCSNRFCSKQSEGSGYRLVCELLPIE